MQYFYRKLIQYSECLVKTVDTDDLVLKHRSYSVEYVPMRSPLFMGKRNEIEQQFLKFSWFHSSELTLK